MKPFLSFSLLIFCIVTFILTACGPESQPATPTLEPTITDTPQPSLTPTPTEIPLPPGSEELISRLGESASVEMNESGRYDLVYNNLVIGEFDKGRQLSISVGEVTVSISTEDLEVKDGVLVLINSERTEEMGVDWVEQAWVEGERIAVPEPVVGLPETYEETLVVQEKSLDYFMPKLLAAEKKWLDENEWINVTNFARISFPHPGHRIGLPYTERAVNVASKPCCAEGGGYVKDGYVVLSSWTRVLMESGKELELVGIPNIAHDREIFFSEFGSEKNYIWHYVYDIEAARNWVTSPDVEKKIRPDHVIEFFKQGAEVIRVRMFMDVREVEGWAEEYGWTEEEIQYSITRFGFEDIDILMKRLITNVPNHGEALGIRMICTSKTIKDGSCQAPEGFLEIMEEQLLPALYLDYPY